MDIVEPTGAIFGRSAQLPLDLHTALPPNGQQRAKATSTFVSNMRLPVHGWFRFSAGFSAEWVAGLLADTRTSTRDHDIVLLDPFAGVGTSVLAGEEVGVTAYGLEAQPFTARIAQTKLLWHSSIGELTRFATAVSENARSKNRVLTPYPKLIAQCYPPAILQDLHDLRISLEECADGSAASELTWLALCAILRVCSPVGTASWQYVLPNKTKATTLPPYEAFALQINKMSADMQRWQRQGLTTRGTVLLSDARNCAGIDDDSINLVVTSPPYTNNYDYADATRLEMSFFGEVQGWGDLKTARRNLVRSCSQHVSLDKVDVAATLKELSDTPIHDEIALVCAQLAEERLRHGGKKDYHRMVAAYFADMNRVWKSLRRVCRADARVCFVIGDSAPYGVYVPVERWLGELAISRRYAIVT